MQIFLRVCRNCGSDAECIFAREVDLMAAKPPLFKMRDVVRAIKGALLAGQKVIGFEVAKDGSLKICLADGQITQPPTPPKGTGWED